MYCFTFWCILVLFCGTSLAQFPAYIDRTIPEAITRARLLTADGESLKSFKNLYSNLTQKIGRKSLLDLHGVLATRNEENPSLCAQHVAFLIDCLIARDPGCLWTWALPMLDATAKPGAGILRGDMNWLGSYSQCAAVFAPNGTGGVMFKGKYCRAYTQFNIYGTPLPLSSGFCIPDSCNDTQFMDLIHSVLSFVNSTTCQPTTQPPLDGPAIAVVTIFVSLALLVLVATIYDEFIRQRYHSDPLLPAATMNHQEPPSEADYSDTAPIVNSTTPELRNNLDVGDYTPHINRPVVKQKCHPGSLNIFLRCLLAFSLSSNGSKLLNVSTQDGTLQVVHGVRFLSMSWVILGHVVALGFNYIDNIVDVLDYAKQWTFAPILSGTLSVDSFFLLRLRISGARRFNWVYFYVHRYWRLTPPYMLVLAFYTAVLPFMGEGPLWPYKLIAPFCDTNWWTNLLYVQNLVQTSKQCFGWAWYLANDMQFFIISPVFILPLYLWDWVGLVFPICGIIGSCVATGVITYRNDYPADIAVSLAGKITSDMTGDWFTNIYIVPWCRLGPYVVGIILGYVLHKTRNNPMPRILMNSARLRVTVVAAGWLVAAGFCFSVVYGLSLAKVPQGHMLSWKVNAFYASVFRPVWSMGLAWLIFACLKGYGGWVNSFLSWSPLTVLSRLTYMAYLLHPMVMSWYWLNLHQTIHFTVYTMVAQFLGFMMATYALSFIFSLLLESPMLALEKVILKK